jgi:hypothetical protein
MSIIVKNFFKIIQQDSFINLKIIKFTFLNSFFLLSLIYCYLLLKNIFFAESQKKVISILYISFIIYIFLTLLAYPLYFDEYEAINLASLERYLSVPFLSILCIFLYFIFNRLSFYSNLKLIIERHILFFIIVFLGVIVYGHQKTINPPSEILAQKNKIENDLLFIKSIVGINDNIYFISQYSFNNDQLFFRGLAYPYAQLNNQCWSIGNKYSFNDVWTCNINLNQAINTNTYSYLYIYSADYNFWDNNRHYFSEEGTMIESGFYKVKIKNKSLHLDLIKKFGAILDNT